MSGGGGGDGGAAQRDSAETARRAAAIDQINAYFGVAPSQKQVALSPATAGKTVYGKTSGMGYGSAPIISRTPGVAAIFGDNPLTSTAATNATGRDALYADTSKNVLDLNLNKLKDFSTTAELQRKQELAKKGQLGSSVDIDSAAAYKRRYDDSATDAQGQADSAALDFRTADEGSRLNLIQAINAGGDVNTGLANATNALRLNADTARAGANSHIINNTFGDLAQQYAFGQDIAGRTDANKARLKAAGLVPGNSGYRGTVSAGGAV